MPLRTGCKTKAPAATLRSLLGAGVLALFVCCGLAAAPLEPFRSAGKWGFRERGTDTVLIPPMFDQAAEFQDDMSRVASGDLWGYVDKSGRLALEPKYAEARPFSGGAAEARLPDGQWVLLDRAGNTLLVSSAPALGRMAGGLVLFARDGRFGYLNAKGRTAIEPEFAAAGAFSEGLAPARRPAGKWGFIDKSGDLVIKPEFEAVRGFSEGLAAFRKDGRWGFIDRKGRVAVKNSFHSALDFSGGLAAMRLNSWWGYLDLQGRIAICPEFTAARSFSGGLGPVSVPVSSSAAESRWIDRDGAVVYRGAGAAGDGLELLLSTAGKYGFARDARPLAEPRYDGAAGCWSGACLVKAGGKMFFADYDGAVLSQTPFDDGAALGCGLYRVRQNGKFGLMNATGTVIASPVYDSIEGGGCDTELAAVMEGAAGRMSPLDGTFAAGPAVPPEPLIPISDKCRAAEPALAAMGYAEIPGHCDAAELGVMIKAYPDCLSCRLAAAAIYSSTAATGAPADAEAALAALAGAIQISSASDKAWLYQWRVGLLLAAGDTAANAFRALPEYRELMRLEPANPDHYRGICAAFSLLNEPPPEGFAALGYCNQAVRNEPGSVKNLIYRANVRRLLGDIAGAQDDFRAAIRQDPFDMEPRLARAKLSEALGQDYRVVFDCSRVLETDPANPAVLEDRAMAYLRMGICGKVLPDLEAAARLRPGPENMHKLAAYYWACERDLFKTLGAVEQLLKLGADSRGSPYWKQDAYQRFLGDLYATPPYIEILRKYNPAPAIAPAAAPPAAPAR